METRVEPFPITRQIKMPSSTTRPKLVLSLSKNENEDSRLLFLDLIINGKGVLSLVVIGSFDNFVDVY